MEINKEYIKLLVSKEISRSEFAILCYNSLHNKWPDKDYCLKKYKIKKSTYYSNIINCKKIYSETVQKNGKQ